MNISINTKNNMNRTIAALLNMRINLKVNVWVNGVVIRNNTNSNSGVIERGILINRAIYIKMNI